MNFIQLVQRAWVECHGSGGGPATVAGVTGHQLNFVNWVSDAWLEIQKEHSEWSFLKTNGSFQTISAQENYGKSAVGLGNLRAPLAVFKLVDNQYVNIPLHASISSADEIYRVNKPAGSPNACYFENSNFSFDTIPDQAYTLKVFYRREPQTLAADSDVPLCDSVYRMTIVWKAVESFALDDEDQALLSKSREKYFKALQSMRGDLLPTIKFGASAYGF